jgi:hypothetical protein
MERLAQEAAPGVVQRDSGLVAGGFDAEDDHEKGLQRGGAGGVAGGAASLI